MIQHNVHAPLVDGIYHILPLFDSAIMGVEERQIYRLRCVSGSKPTIIAVTKKLTEYESTPHGRLMNGEPAM
jgi:hypothetical protein